MKRHELHMQRAMRRSTVANWQFKKKEETAIVCSKRIFENGRGAHGRGELMESVSWELLRRVRTELEGHGAKPPTVYDTPRLLT